jgi:hypothetical protein
LTMKKSKNVTKVPASTTSNGAQPTDVASATGAGRSSVSDLIENLLEWLRILKRRR